MKNDETIENLERDKNEILKIRKKESRKLERTWERNMRRYVNKIGHNGGGNEPSQAKLSFIINRLSYTQEMGRKKIGQNAKEKTEETLSCN